jgi:hypothetical protein
MSDFNSTFFRYISSRNLLIDEEQQRRNEQLEALKLEQGDSDEEDAEKNLSDDEEMERWEREQISKGVGRKKVSLKFKC